MESEAIQLTGDNGLTKKILVASSADDNDKPQNGQTVEGAATIILV